MSGPLAGRNGSGAGGPPPSLKLLLRDVVLAALRTRGRKRYQLSKVVRWKPYVLCKLLHVDPAKRRRATEEQALLIAAGVALSVDQMLKANRLLWPLGFRFEYDDAPEFMQVSSASFVTVLRMLLDEEHVSLASLARATNLGERLDWIMDGGTVEFPDAVRMAVAICVEAYQLQEVNRILAASHHPIISAPAGRLTSGVKARPADAASDRIDQGLGSISNVNTTATTSTPRPSTQRRRVAS